MRKLLPLIFVVASATTSDAQLVVRDQQYRCPVGDNSCFASGKAAAFETGESSKKHAPYTINYVEYSDSGEPFAPKELDDALDQIKTVTDGGRLHPIIVVYAHGWENNAKPGTGDVTKFHDFIDGLADEYSPQRPSATSHVIGIYLAWRGESSSIEPFKHFFSYWPRRHFAEKMGETGMYYAVNKIAALINDRDHPETRQNTILILAGHSFGARVMENAVDGLSKKKERGFLKRYFEETDRAVTSAETSKSPEAEEKLHNLAMLPADLVVYINAATSSERTITRVKKIEKQCSRHSLPMCKADPFYVALTSTGDSATGIIMPIANFVFPDIPTDHLHLISAANSPWLHTHKKPESGCEPNTLCFNITDQNNVTGPFYLPRIQSRMQIPGADPFWIFNVDRNVSRDHGDVWNANVLSLITAILQNNDHYRIVKEKVKLE